ncbi:hypothetical protein ABIB73_003273 [Bradyrhizobium sp. F1.4.3]|uniref:hypothetical protein n=1 Tax=Bradyrhizobium sp. F1.4.3 TaxID=3156356 RepID=UPI0033961BCC
MCQAIRVGSKSTPLDPLGEGSIRSGFQTRFKADRASSGFESGERIIRSPPSSSLCFQRLTEPHERIQLIKQALAGRLYEDSPYVFPWTRGKGDKPIDRHALSQAVRRLWLKLKKAEWSPHDARRSATTWARAMGIPRDTTEALTHHAIVGSGKTYYRYDMQAEKRQAVDAIAEYVSGALHRKAIAAAA